MDDQFTSSFAGGDAKQGDEGVAQVRRHGEDHLLCQRVQAARDLRPRHTQQFQ